MLVALIVLGLGLYLLPTVVAGMRGHNQFAAICAVNLLLGWSFLGWVVAMVWALTEVRRRYRGGYGKRYPNPW